MFSHIGIGPAIGKCPTPWPRKLANAPPLPFRGSDKVGKCPAVVLGGEGGTLAQLD